LPCAWFKSKVLELTTEAMSNMPPECLDARLLSLADDLEAVTAELRAMVPCKEGRRRG
jgi:hypothetical protein